MNELTPKTQLKIQQWLEIIHLCRESGLSNEQWCTENRISLKSYYYWLAKIRKLAIENVPRKERPGTLLQSGPETIREQTVFAQLPDLQDVGKHSGITLHFHDFVLEIPPDTPETLINSVLAAVSKC